MKERIYRLTLDILDPNVPFQVRRSIGESSGDLIKVFSCFQLQLVKLLKELHEEDSLEERMRDDDIPF